MKKTKDEIVEDYYYLKFLYSATHQEPFCSSPPHQVNIEPTNHCNLNCTHCVQNQMEREKGFMDFELYKKIIDDLAPYKPYIDLHLQGEPLIHEKIPDMVSYAREKGLLPRIITNTTLLTKELSQKLIKAGLDKIVFSFSGATKETYEKIHKNAKFEMTLQNILDFLLMQKKLESYEVHTRVVLVEEEKTKGEIDKFKEKFEKLPIDKVSISPLVNFFGENEEVDVEQFKDIPYEEWPVCKHPWKTLGITWDGKVRGCIFDYDNRYLFGDASKKDVIEIWNSDKAIKFREALLNKEFDKIEENGPLCTECSQLWNSSESKATTQWPESFEKEAKKHFENNEKSSEIKDDHLEDKFNYLESNYDKWLEEMKRE